MTIDPDDFYYGRRQTEIKHAVLRAYLERFSHIVGSTWAGLTYVDCFSGPWESKSPDFSDTSFVIALEELRKAQRNLQEAIGKRLDIRFFFLEKDPKTFDRLKNYADQIEDAEVEVKNAALEDSVVDIVKFVTARDDCFPFCFIDPKGWTGFGMKKIEPLLRLNPVEVLVNFQSGFIQRFLETECQDEGDSFETLYGDESYLQRVLNERERFSAEDADVRVYGESLMDHGDFPYSARAIVLHEEMNRTYFNLVYATRNRKGVEVFKKAERKAMRRMEELRLEYQKTRTSEAGQGLLFVPADPNLESTIFFSEVRDRYVRNAMESVEIFLRSEGRISYDAAWDLAMKFPSVWDSDLKHWIKQASGSFLCIEGLGPREKVPKLGRGHMLILKSD